MYMYMYMYIYIYVYVYICLYIKYINVFVKNVQKRIKMEENVQIFNKNGWKRLKVMKTDKNIRKTDENV